jgi:uncharacterized protein involved in exopolysaccharide biosynthesis
MTGFVKRKWKLMVLGALLGGGIGFSATLVLKPPYQAQCLIEPRGGADADALVIKLVRPSLLKAVGEDIARDKTFYGSNMDVGESLSAQKVAAGLIRLRCTGPEPMICERVLDLALDEYRQSLLERGAQEEEEEGRMIREQISKYREAAAEGERELNRFLEKYSWLTDHADEEGGIVAAYEKKEKIHAANIRQVEKLGDELAAAREKRDKIKARFDNEEKNVVVEMIKEINPDLMDLEQELLAKQKELRQFMVDSSDEHPMVKRLKKEIAATKKMIDEEPKEIIKEQKVSLNPIYTQLSTDLFKAETEVKDLEARRAALQQEITLYEQGRREIPPDEWKRIAALEKEQRKKLELIGSLKSRLSSTFEKKGNGEATALEFSVVDPPVAEKAAGERWAFAAIGGLIGLLVGASLPAPGKK